MGLPPYPPLKNGRRLLKRSPSLRLLPSSSKENDEKENGEKIWNLSLGYRRRLAENPFPH